MIMKNLNRHLLSIKCNDRVIQRLKSITLHVKLDEFDGIDGTISTVRNNQSIQLSNKIENEKITNVLVHICRILRKIAPTSILPCSIKRFLYVLKNFRFTKYQRNHRLNRQHNFVHGILRQASQTTIEHNYLCVYTIKLNCKPV